MVLEKIKEMSDPESRFRNDNRTFIRPCFSSSSGFDGEIIDKELLEISQHSSQILKQSRWAAGSVAYSMVGIASIPASYNVLGRLQRYFWVCESGV
jgi:hypothetical protein